MPSTIEWTDETWNPVVGCSRVSAGCMNCYAERVAHRGLSPQHRGLTQLSSRGPQWTGEVRFLPEKLGEPLRWRKPRKVFVNSMSDLFHPRLSNAQIAAVFGVMAASSEHTFQVLTKRPERMLEWFAWLEENSCFRDVTDIRAAAGARSGDDRATTCAAVASDALEPMHVSKAVMFDRAMHRATWPLPNVWLGVSAENQATADERIPLLILAPAAARFVSAEPLLGPIDLNLFGRSSGFPEHITREGRAVGMPHPLHWVIVGGETGPGSRECDLAWVRGIMRQCRDAGVACFVKQLGARPVGWASNGLPPVLGGHIASWPEDLQVRQWPEVRDGT